MSAVKEVVRVTFPSESHSDLDPWNQCYRASAENEAVKEVVRPFSRSQIG